MIQQQRSAFKINNISKKKINGFQNLVNEPKDLSPNQMIAE